MAGFNINEFKSEVSARNGIMRKNKFLVTFPTPPVLLGLQNTNRSIEYWCEAVNFPGYMLGSHDVRRWTYGPVEKRPLTPTFLPLSCTFMNDSDNDVMSFFDAWMQSIIPHNTSQGINTIQPNNGSLAYEIEYKSRYVTDINIFVYDVSGKLTTNIVCREAFPIQLVDVPLNWSDRDIFRFQINFQYLDWYKII